MFALFPRVYWQWAKPRDATIPFAPYSSSRAQPHSSAMTLITTDPTFMNAWKLRNGTIWAARRKTLDRVLRMGQVETRKAVEFFTRLTAQTYLRIAWTTTKPRGSAKWVNQIEQRTHLPPDPPIDDIDSSWLPAPALHGVYVEWRIRPQWHWNRK